MYYFGSPKPASKDSPKQPETSNHGGMATGGDSKTVAEKVPEKVPEPFPQFSFTLGSYAKYVSSHLLFVSFFSFLFPLFLFLFPFYLIFFLCSLLSTWSSVSHCTYTKVLGIIAFVDCCYCIELMWHIFTTEVNTRANIVLLTPNQKFQKSHLSPYHIDSRVETGCCPLLCAQKYTHHDPVLQCRSQWPLQGSSGGDYASSRRYSRDRG